LILEEPLLGAWCKMTGKRHRAQGWDRLLN
jgi:hypothetical protein